MARFCCLRPYLSIETVFLSSVTTDGGDEHGLKREKVGLMFSEYACKYQQVSENTKYLWIKYLFIVLVEETGYESRQTSKLKTTVL